MKNMNPIFTFTLGLWLAGASAFAVELNALITGFRKDADAVIPIR